MITSSTTTSADRAFAGKARDPKDQALQEACAEFEAMLISKLFTTMHENQSDNGLIPRSQGERMFQEMLDGEYAKEISRTNPAGIAAMLYKQIKDSVPPSKLMGGNADALLSTMHGGKNNF